jgi:hypothetical protein
VARRLHVATLNQGCPPGPADTRPVTFRATRGRTPRRRACPAPRSDPGLIAEIGFGSKEKLQSSQRMQTHFFYRHTPNPHPTHRAA